MDALELYANLLKRIKKLEEGGAGGTTNYNDLDNKPRINGVELTGDVALEDIITDGNEVAY